jgi:hypothetical protein
VLTVGEQDPHERARLLGLDLDGRFFCLDLEERLVVVVVLAERGDPVDCAGLHVHAEAG